jgi:DNA-binding NtrC family response regulator
MTMDTQDALRVMLVEDDDGVRLAAAQTLQLAGFEVSALSTAEEALAQMQPDFAGIVVSDVRLPGRDGLALLRELRRADPEMPVILVTGHGDVAMAVEAMREGAFDFIPKPFKGAHIAVVVEKALEQQRLKSGITVLTEEIDKRHQLIAGTSPAMTRAVEQAKKAAATHSTVLLLGGGLGLLLAFGPRPSSAKRPLLG